MLLYLKERNALEVPCPPKLEMLPASMVFIVSCIEFTFQNSIGFLIFEVFNLDHIVSIKIVHASYLFFPKFAEKIRLKKTLYKITLNS